MSIVFIILLEMLDVNPLWRLILKFKAKYKIFLAMRWIMLTQDIQSRILGGSINVQIL
jgi:hypothetical protein